MGDWVLIDSSYLGYRAVYTTNGLEFENQATGILYGFFEQLRTICSDPRVLSNKVAIFFDSRKSIRQLEFPWYKESRRNGVRRLEPEEYEKFIAMKEQMLLLRKEVLPAIGLPVYMQTGLESDDLIAQAASHYNGKTREAVMITADADLYQCISPAVHWYDVTRKKYYDPASFEEAKGIPPTKWALVKQMMGCHTDDVPGIPGIGEKSAIAYITGKLPHAYKTYFRIACEKGQEVVKRNERLVKLPHPRTRTVVLQNPEYDQEAFRSFCERYGITSFFKGKRGDEWGLFFKNGLERQKADVRSRGCPF